MATPKTKVAVKKWTGEQIVKLLDVVGTATKENQTRVQKLLNSPALAVLCRKIERLNEAVLLEMFGEKVYRIVETKFGSPFEVIEILVDVRVTDLKGFLRTKQRRIANASELRRYWNGCTQDIKCKWIFLACDVGDIVYWEPRGYISNTVPTEDGRFPLYRTHYLLVVKQGKK